MGLLLRLFLVFFLVGHQPTLAAKQLTICRVVGDAVPVGSAANPMTWEQLSSLYNKHIASLNVQIKIVKLPWKRCLKSISRNQIDGVMLVVHTHDREHFLAYPMNNAGEIDKNLNAFLSVNRIFYHRRKEVKFENGKISPPNALVGAPMGYHAHQLLKDLGNSPKESYTPTQGFMALNRGALDGFVIEETVGIRTIQNLGLDENDIRQDSNIFFELESYIAFSHQLAESEPDLVQSLWEQTQSFILYLEANYPPN